MIVHSSEWRNRYQSLVTSQRKLYCWAIEMDSCYLYGVQTERVKKRFRQIPWYWKIIYELVQSKTLELYLTELFPLNKNNT